MPDGREMGKVLGVVIVGALLAVAALWAVQWFWPAWAGFAPTIVSYPVALLILNLTMLTLYRLAWKKDSDGRHIWGLGERRALAVALSLLVAVTILMTAFLVYREFPTLQAYWR